MRYRLTKLQIKMMADGKTLKMNHVVIYPNSETQITCKKIIETGLCDHYDFFIEGGAITCERKNT